jgi:hypothetical protein
MIFNNTDCKEILKFTRQVVRKVSKLKGKKLWLIEYDFNKVILTDDCVNYIIKILNPYHEGLSDWELYIQSNEYGHYYEEFLAYGQDMFIYPYDKDEHDKFSIYG